MKSSADVVRPLVSSLEVLCPPDRKKGRKRLFHPVPVKRYALEHGLTFHHTPCGKSLKDWNMPGTVVDIDIGVAVSFVYKIVRLRTGLLRTFVNQGIAYHRLQICCSK